MQKLVHSHWSHAPIQATQPSLQGHQVADVVVVGGGINGLSTALELRKAGADVALIDRGAIGAQSSTKNFGVLTTVWDYPGFSLDQRRQMVRFAENAIYEMGETLKAEGLDAEFEVRDNWKIVKEEKNRKLLLSNLAELKQLGYDCDFVSPDKVRITSAPTFGAGRIRQWTVNPAKYVEALKTLALRAGVKIYENSAVVSVDDGSIVRVRTRNGYISTQKAVICVNGFTSSLGINALGHSLPVHIHALATRPLPPDIAGRIGTVFGSATDVASRLEGSKVFWQRLLPSGVFLFGGGKFTIPRAQDRLTPRMEDDRAAGIVAELRKRYPFLSPSDVDCFWSGAITGPAKERPIIAPMGKVGNVIMVQCCFGHGMGLGTAIGGIVKELVLPGSVEDQGALTYLHYAAPRPDFMRWAEGMVFRVLANTPARQLANAGM